MKILKFFTITLTLLYAITSSSDATAVSRINITLSKSFNTYDSMAFFCMYASVNCIEWYFANGQYTTFYTEIEGGGGGPGSVGVQEPIEEYQ